MGIRRNIKTNLGIYSRDDFEFWNKIYLRYLDLRSLVPLAKEIGVDTRMITSIFKELGLKKMSSAEARTGSIKKNYVETLGGNRYLLDDKEFWDNIYNLKYIKEGYSESRLSELLDISRKQIRRVFKYYKYPPKTEADIKKTIINSNMNIYGIERPTRDVVIKKKISESHLNRVREGMLNKLLSIGYEIQDDYIGTRVFNTGGPNSTTYNKYKIKHLDCGTVFEDELGRIPRCPKCYKIESQLEDNIRKYIESRGYKTQKLRIDDGDTFKELDIFIPELNIGFEYNGTIWHSSKHKTKPSYHKHKTELFLNKGIKIYHIWEHDNELIIKSKIDNILGVSNNKLHARKLLVRRVDDLNQNLFLDDNHLFGYSSSLFSLGLYENEDLVGIMSFKRVRDEIEMTRYCLKLNTSIRGGFSKLLKHAIELIKNEYKDISKMITFGYRDWCPDYRDCVYNKFFNFVSYSDPSLYYYKHTGKKIYNRQHFMKHKLKDLFPKTYDENLTEKEILEKNGIYAIYNSGIIKYEKNI